MSGGRRASTTTAHSFANATPEQNIYAAWFLAFSAALEVIGQEI